MRDVPGVSAGGAGDAPGTSRGALLGVQGMSPGLIMEAQTRNLFQEVSGLVTNRFGHGPLMVRETAFDQVEIQVQVHVLISS